MTPHERNLAGRERVMDELYGSEAFPSALLISPAPGHFEQPKPLGARCPLPNWWRRWRCHVVEGTVWVCECGERWVWTGPPRVAPKGGYFAGRSGGWVQESSLKEPLVAPQPPPPRPGKNQPPAEVLPPKPPRRPTYRWFF